MYDFGSGSGKFGDFGVKIVNINDFLRNVWYNFPIDKFWLSVSQGIEWKMMDNPLLSVNLARQEWVWIIDSYPLEIKLELKDG